MTREELHGAFNELGNTNVAIAIDGVIDDFESRTCDNCKYMEIYKYFGNCCTKDVSEGFSVGLVYDYDNLPTLPKGFGCNKFERIT